MACTFLEASSSTERATALSCDSRGRLVFHNVTGYLSITNFIAGEADPNPRLWTGAHMSHSSRVLPGFLAIHIQGELWVRALR